MPLSQASDFDFFIGEWSVQHHRLDQRLAQCDRWTDFHGTTVTRTLLGGQGNVDDNVLELPGNQYRAATIRTFDPTSRQWSIWWLDSRHPHQLDPPMRGSFVDGVGTFYGDDNFGGRPIRVRFLWSDISAGSCRWQQAFSTDGGATWETNWIMNFTRLR